MQWWICYIGFDIHVYMNVRECFHLRFTIQVREAAAKVATTASSNNTATDTAPLPSSSSSSSPPPPNSKSSSSDVFFPWDTVIDALLMAAEPRKHSKPLATAGLSALLRLLQHVHNPPPPAETLSSISQHISFLATAPNLSSLDDSLILKMVQIVLALPPPPSPALLVLTFKTAASSSYSTNVTSAARIALQQCVLNCMEAAAGSSTPPLAFQEDEDESSIRTTARTIFQDLCMIAGGHTASWTGRCLQINANAFFVFLVVVLLKPKLTLFCSMIGVMDHRNRACAIWYFWSHSGV